MTQNCPATNAGLGSNLTEEGGVECDASIMAHDGCFGAVGACPGNPLSLSLHLPAQNNLLWLFPLHSTSWCREIVSHRLNLMVQGNCQSLLERVWLPPRNILHIFCFLLLSQASANSECKFRCGESNPGGEPHCRGEPPCHAPPQSASHVSLPAACVL